MVLKSDASIRAKDDSFVVEEIRLLDGFDEALVGITGGFGGATPRAVYDANVALGIFADENRLSDSQARFDLAALAGQWEDVAGAPLFIFKEPSEVPSDSDLTHPGFDFSH